MKQSSGFVELHNGPPGVKKKFVLLTILIRFGRSPKGLLTPLIRSEGVADPVKHAHARHVLPYQLSWLSSSNRLGVRRWSTKFQSSASVGPVVNATVTCQEITSFFSL